MQCTITSVENFLKIVPVYDKCTAPALRSANLLKRIKSVNEPKSGHLTSFCFGHFALKVIETNQNSFLFWAYEDVLRIHYTPFQDRQIYSMHHLNEEQSWQMQGKAMGNWGE